MIEALNVIDLFSGSGQLGLAFHEALLESLGLRTRTAIYCEYVDRSKPGSDYPTALLLSRMLRGEIDSAPIHNDITTLEVETGGGEQEWAIVGGWPCQGNSLAGNRKGMADERSGLVVEVIRLVRLVRPVLIFLENVSGVLTAPGDGVGFVANALAQLGYDMRWTDLAASDVGQAHERQRFWLLAYRVGGECGRQSDAASREQRNGQEAGRDQSAGEFECVGERMGQRENQRHERSRGTRRRGTRPPNAGAGAGLGDDISAGLEKRSSQSGNHGQKQPALERASYPLVPPGREDHEAWEQVIDLQLDIEPTLRRVVARVAHRADRIRVIGNGVDFPTAKAAAIALLKGE